MSIGIRMDIAKLSAKIGVSIAAVLVLVPMVVIVAAIGEFDVELWDFLLEYQLPVLLKNTAILAVGVGLGVLFVGASSAWLLAMYRFPSSHFLTWAMMLPLAVPAYVLAFTQLGLFEYSGVISTYLRERWGFENGLPDIKNAFGVSAVMTLAFYPYVYLLAKNAFATMGSRALEVGASLGLSPVQSFVKIALPMARPWLAGGLMLALMEVLADFGAVSIFGFETFTTAIYEAWFGFFSLQTAKQLASLLIGFVFVLVVFEQLSRRHRRFEQAGRGNDTVPLVLRGWKAYLAAAYCWLVLLLAFFVPIGQLIVWTFETWQGVAWQQLWQQAWHSLAVSLVGAMTVTVVALAIVLAIRYDDGYFTKIAAKLSVMGYAIPGTVLAVGVFVPVAHLDNWLIATFGLPEGTVIFRTTLSVMIVAYLIRFLALGVSSVAAGMERIKPSYAEAANSLGVSGFAVLHKVYLPLLKGSLGVALLMTFVDIMKEMPITLMMRPHDWDMLSVRIYAFTMEGMFDKAALPALVIVITGLVPVLLFSRWSNHRQAVD